MKPLCVRRREAGQARAKRTGHFPRGPLLATQRHLTKSRALQPDDRRRTPSPDAQAVPIEPGKPTGANGKLFGFAGTYDGKKWGILNWVNYVYSLTIPQLGGAFRQPAVAEVPRAGPRPPDAARSRTTRRTASAPTPSGGPPTSATCSSTATATPPSPPTWRTSTATARRTGSGSSRAGSATRSTARASPTAWRAAGCTGCTRTATPTASGAGTPRRSSTASCAEVTRREPRRPRRRAVARRNGLLRLELRHAGLPQLGALRQLAVATPRSPRSAPAAPSRRGGGPLLPPTTPLWSWSLIESRRPRNAPSSSAPRWRRPPSPSCSSRHPPHGRTRRVGHVPRGRVPRAERLVGARAPGNAGFTSAGEPFTPSGGGTCPSGAGSVARPITPSGTRSPAPAGRSRSRPETSMTPLRSTR